MICLEDELIFRERCCEQESKMDDAQDGGVETATHSSQREEVGGQEGGQYGDKNLVGQIEEL